MKPLILLLLTIPAISLGDTPAKKYPKNVVAAHSNSESNAEATANNYTDNSNWLENKLNQFNEQANRQSMLVNPQCDLELGSQSIGDASHSVPSWCIGVSKGEYQGWAGSIGYAAPIISQSAKDAMDHELTKLNNEKSMIEVLDKMQKTNQSLLRELSEQRRRIDELENSTEEK